MKILQKLIAGGPGRLTRLHTERGEIVPLAELRHLPTVLYQFAQTKLTGRRPDLPWWPMPVIPIIADHLTPQSEVLEFGSGSSTVWLARRARTVVAVEDHEGWTEKVSGRLRDLGLDNAQVRFATGNKYYDLDFLEDAKFDLIVVDGSYRWKCIEVALARLKPGAVLYLDNSDADKDTAFYEEPSTRHRAQKLLEHYAHTHPGTVLSRHAGLLNGELHAIEGMMIRLPSS